MSSYHDAKGIAGNIIPAISTTNAIVAGIQVAQAVRILAAGCRCDDMTPETLKQLPHAYCNRKPTRRGNYLQPTQAEPPNPHCFVCQSSQLRLSIDTSKALLSDLITKVVKARLGFNEPYLTIGSSVIYEDGLDDDEDEDGYQDNLKLVLEACPAGGIVDGTILAVSDFTQKLDMKLVVKHVATEDLEKMGEAVAADLFAISGQWEPAPAPLAPPAPAAENDTETAQEVSIDDIEIIEELPTDTAATSSEGKKRSHGNDDFEIVEEAATPAKRAK